MANTKETRLFICDLSDFEEYSNTSISADIIAEIEEHQELKEFFISLAEKRGMVYSLTGLQDAINNNQIDFTESYIFITNNY